MEHPEPPTMRYIPGDEDSMYHRVQVHFPGSPVRVNVGETWVEWGTDRAGMNGADIELREDGGCQLRFQESSRLFVCDRTGVRIFDSDTEREDALILRLDHEDYHRGLPPVVGPAAYSWAAGTPEPDTESAVQHSTRQGTSYESLIREAAGLLEPDEVDANPEYLRGMCELIARTFGIPDMPTDDRASYIEADIRAMLRGEG